MSDNSEEIELNKVTVFHVICLVLLLVQVGLVVLLFTQEYTNDLGALGQLLEPMLWIIACTLLAIYPVCMVKDHNSSLQWPVKILLFEQITFLPIFLIIFVAGVLVN